MCIVYVLSALNGEHYSKKPSHTGLLVRLRGHNNESQYACLLAIYIVATQLCDVYSNYWPVYFNLITAYERNDASTSSLVERSGG